MSRYDLTEFEWRVIQPLLPNKSRGVPRVDDRRVLNGIFWVLRSGSPWRDLPERYGPRTTCYNRFRRWAAAGVWDRIMDAITDAYSGDVRMINGTSVRVHHSTATLKKATRIDVLDEGSPERLPRQAVEGQGRSYYENPCSDRRAWPADVTPNFHPVLIRASALLLPMRAYEARGCVA